MASIYDLKSSFQDLLYPLLHRLRSLGVTPNALTISAVVLSAVVGALPLFIPDPIILLCLPVWLFTRMALNALDGMMAREYNLSTVIGSFLNEIGDVLSDLVLYLPLVVFAPGAPVTQSSVIAFGVGAVLTEFCGILPQAAGGRRQYEGPMGKSDRAFFCGAVALAGAMFPVTLTWWSYLFLTADALIIVTCWRRLQAGISVIRSDEDPNGMDRDHHDTN